MEKITVDMDMDAEVAAIVDFVKQKWSPIPNLEQLVTRVRDQALYNARAWFHEWKFGAAVNDLAEQREKLLEALLDDPEEKSASSLYDNVVRGLEQIRRPCSTMREAALTLDVDHENKNFDDFTVPLSKRLIKDLPGFSKSKPVGWAALSKSYGDRSASAEYDLEPDRQLFQGVDPEARTWHLVEKLALPNLMYDYKEQGRTPTYMLVSSIYSHFLFVIENINTQKMISAVENAFPLEEPGLIFGLKLSPSTSNPHIDVLLASMSELPSKEMYERSVQNSRDFAALSDDEKAERRSANAVKIKAVMEQSFAIDPEKEKLLMEKRRKEIQEMKVLMRTAFQAIDPSAQAVRQPSLDADLGR